MTTALDKVLYTAQAHATGGGMEQDVVAGLQPACFIGAMKAVGPKVGVKVPDDVAVDSSVSLGPTNGGAAYGIAVKLAVTLPGLDADAKQKLVAAAHQVCPYSNATRGNIPVELSIA